MGVIDNGGAHAIKGFNYQKSIIVLIAVLHYLDEEKVDIYVEAEDDIVIKTKERKTYIQSKSSDLSLSSITARKGGKDSILEKNLSSGDAKSRYKIITPQFGSSDRYLSQDVSELLTEGARIYSYSQAAELSICKKLPTLSKMKLKESRVALTSFPANHKDALTHIKGVMANNDISVDNSYGAASLGELCLRIDQKSEIIAKDTYDYEAKKITQADLKQIFNHTLKAKYYEDILKVLKHSVMRQGELIKRHSTIRPTYSSYVDQAKREIEKMEDVLNVDERTILDRVKGSMSTTVGIDDLDKEAIAISALSQVIFERSLT